MTEIIYGPTPEAKQELRDGYAASSREWTRRASEALVRGDREAARLFAAVARTAADVARGREP